MPFTSFSAAGVAAIQAGIVNLNGYPMGITGSLSAGAGAPLKVMRFAKRFGGMLPGPVWATAIGDNHRSIHEYAFNPAQMLTATFMFHGLDLDAYVGFLQLKKFTVGNSYGALIQSNAPVNAAQACVVVNIDAQDADPGQFGLKRFINEIYPLITVASKLGNAQEVNPIEWEYEGRPTQSGKTPWGIPYTVATHGATRAGGFPLTSDYPLVIETFLAAGAEVTYTLAYTPALPTATYVNLWKDTSGTSAPYAFTVTGKVATFAGLTAGDILIFLYEATDFLANL